MTGGAKGGSALDLYAGVGFFTLPLAKAFTKVVSVDANLAATRDLYANAESRRRYASLRTTSMRKIF